tara:strand:- start:136 stop:1845 length:1710 start_codon:yes stop_codon:yes gene_type:complete
MKFKFTITDTFEAVHDGLTEYQGAFRVFYFSGIEESYVTDVLDNIPEEQLSTEADAITENNFILFVFDKVSGNFYGFNDKYGHHEIFMRRVNSGHLVVSEIDPALELTIDNDAAYEFLVCQAVRSPRTIYKEFETVPIANYVLLNGASGSREYVRYWDIERLFTPKSTNYEELLSNLRDVFYSEIQREHTPQSGIALSGGIDSGGILGILHDKYGADIVSFSYGAHGKGSNDLISSRKTAAAFKSKNIELYPSGDNFEVLLRCSQKLNQPISGDLLIPQLRIFSVAQQEGITKMYFGYGTQMILGNLGLNRLWHKTRFFEKLLSKKVVSKLLSYAAKSLGKTENVQALLSETNWTRKFFYTQAALFTREKHIYRDVPDDFIDSTINFLEPINNRKDMILSDRIVMFYLLGWTNYTQDKVSSAMGRIFGVTAFSPYNSPKVTEMILKTPDSFRKKNKWNKQLWRDALKPYVPEHLYMRKGKSLVIPYSKIFYDGLDYFLPYLEGSELLNKLIDFKVYKETYYDLPEPGLNLLRLISFATWYDARHSPERLAELRKVLSDFNIDLKMNFDA